MLDFIDMKIATILLNRSSSAGESTENSGDQ